MDGEMEEQVLSIRSKRGTTIFLKIINSHYDHHTAVNTTTEAKILAAIPLQQP